MASLIEGGIAGKFELKTARPLDMTENFQGSLNIRGSYNDRASQQPDAHEFGYRVSASIQAKQTDDTLAIPIGHARLVQPNVETRLRAYCYGMTAANGGANACAPDATAPHDRIHDAAEHTRHGRP